jgi:hypothetical protein
MENLRSRVYYFPARNRNHALAKRGEGEGGLQFGNVVNIFCTAYAKSGGKRILTPRKQFSCSFVLPASREFLGKWEGYRCFGLSDLRDQLFLSLFTYYFLRHDGPISVVRVSE